MKTASAILLSALCLFFSGCATALDSLLPEGQAATVHYTRTGKFSSTTILAENFVKTTTQVKADRISVKHSNAWIPNIEVTATGYTRQVETK